MFIGKNRQKIPCMVMKLNETFGLPDGEEDKEDDEEIPERDEPQRQERRVRPTRVRPQTQTPPDWKEEVGTQRSQIKR